MIGDYHQHSMGGRSAAHTCTQLACPTPPNDRETSPRKDTPRLGPDVGGCKSRKRDRFVRDRSRARLSARQSVQRVPVMARSLGHLRAEGTQQERSRTRIVLALQVCTTAAHRDVDAAPMERWSDRGLQVTNLKATGAQLSSAQTNTGHDKPHTIILAPPCMHQTCCMHLQLGARRLSVETV